MRGSIACIALLSLFGTFARAQEGAPAANLRTISSTGEAVVYVVPDQVVVGLGVETFNQNLDKAKAASDEACAKLVKAVKELKIEDRDIQNDVMNIEIRYAQSTHLQIEGYVARRTYSITLKDTKQFEKLVDAALKNGANQLMGFEFKTTELRKHRDAARKMAIKAAKEKAGDLARELDCKVARPRTITEGYAGGSYGGYWGWNRYAGGNSFNNAQQVASAPGGGDGDQTMMLGQIAVRATVSVTFDLDAQ